MLAQGDCLTSNHILLLLCAQLKNNRLKRLNCAALAGAGQGRRLCAWGSGPQQIIALASRDYWRRFSVWKRVLVRWESCPESAWPGCRAVQPLYFGSMMGIARCALGALLTTSRLAKSSGRAPVPPEPAPPLVPVLQPVESACAPALLAWASTRAWVWLHCRPRPLGDRASLQQWHQL